MAGKKLKQVQKNRGKESPKPGKAAAPSTVIKSTTAQPAQKNVANKAGKQSPKAEAIRPQNKSPASKFPERRLSPFGAAKTIRDLAGEEDTMPVPASSGLRNFLQQTSKAINAASLEEDSERDMDEQTLAPDENRPYRFARISYSSNKFAGGAKALSGQPAAKKAVRIVDARKNQGEKKT